MPTKAEVSQKVKTEIATLANIDVDLVKDEHILTDAPLNLDKVALGVLTLILRKYIKSYRHDKTLLVKDVRKSGLTVKTLIDLIYKTLQETL